MQLHRVKVGEVLLRDVRLLFSFGIVCRLDCMCRGGNNPPTAVNEMAHLLL